MELLSNAFNYSTIVQEYTLALSLSSGDIFIAAQQTANLPSIFGILIS